jgi:hypothetical protein
MPTSEVVSFRLLREGGTKDCRVVLSVFIIMALKSIPQLRYFFQAEISWSETESFICDFERTARDPKAISGLMLSCHYAFREFGNIVVYIDFVERTFPQL